MSEMQEGTFQDIAKEVVTLTREFVNKQFKSY